MEPTEGKSREERKAQAHAWRKRYESALEAIFAREDATLDALVDTIWNKGILDRIAPLSEDEKQARKEMGSDIWEGTRDDPELYLRIAYGAAAYKEAVLVRQWTGTDFGYAPGAIIQAFGTLMMQKESGVARRFFKATDNPVEKLFDQVINRAQSEVRAHGGTPHEPFIPWGAEGLYQGIPVTVTSYTGDGRIVLKANGGYEDHQRLGVFTQSGTVSPSTLRPEDFQTPEPPESTSYEFEATGGRAVGMKLLDVKRFLVENHIVPDHDTSWQPAFFKATQPYEGKSVRVKVVYEKGKGISFEVSEIKK